MLPLFFEIRVNKDDGLISEMHIINLWSHLSAPQLASSSSSPIEHFLSPNDPYSALPEAFLYIS
jgi:hypothetical protein